MANVEFHDYCMQVIDALDDKINTTLEEVAGEVEARVKRKTAVQTGKTKNSFQHRVDTEAHIAYIGSDYENAIWEEFGTGEYALNGDGRKGGWKYEDEQGNWHFTRGKKPKRTFFNVYTAFKQKIMKRFAEVFKGL